MRAASPAGKCSWWFGLLWLRCCAICSSLWWCSATPCKVIWRSPWRWGVKGGLLVKGSAPKVLDALPKQSLFNLSLSFQAAFTQNKQYVYAHNHSLFSLQFRWVWETASVSTRTQTCQDAVFKRRPSIVCKWSFAAVETTTSKTGLKFSGSTTDIWISPPKKSRSESMRADYEGLWGE